MIDAQTLPRQRSLEVVLSGGVHVLTFVELLLGDLERPSHRLRLWRSIPPLRETPEQHVRPCAGHAHRPRPFREHEQTGGPFNKLRVELAVVRGQVDDFAAIDEGIDGLRPVLLINV